MIVERAFTCASVIVPSSINAWWTQNKREWWAWWTPPVWSQWKAFIASITRRKLMNLSLI